MHLISKPFGKHFFCLLSISMFTLGVLFSGFAMADDKAAVVPPEYKLNFSLENNLVLFKGKYVYIHLKSGQTLNGKVKDVKNGMLHLEKISNRNYFDALVLVNEISAMEAQFRGLK